MNTNNTNGPEFNEDEKEDLLIQRFMDNLSLNEDAEEDDDNIVCDGPAPESAYILVGEVVRKAKSFFEYMDALESDKTIAKDIIHFDCDVITTFLVIDHNFGKSSTPILFSTVASYKDEIINIEYNTYEAAVTGHRELVEQLRIAVANNL